MLRLLYLLLNFHAVPQRSLLVLMSDLWILNLCLKLMAEPTYFSLQLQHVIKYITLQLSHEKLPLMK